MSDMTSVFAEITKSTPQDDGSLLVYGKATGSDLDLDEQRCDAAWLNTAMPQWFRTAGNVREQHDSKRAVGKAIEHETTADGSHMIRARIVDPIAKAKVEAGILTGFSIGIKAPRVQKSTEAKNGLIVGGQVIEVSLVDRPCLPTATLMMCKAAAPGWEGSPADLDEDLGLVKCEELSLGAEAVEDVEKTTDVDHLEAPAPGQVCAVCGEDGHLMCGEKAADAIDTVEGAQVAADALLANVDGAADSVEIVKAEEPPLAATALGQLGLLGAAGVEKAAEPEFDVDQAKALVAALVGKEGAEAAKAAGELLAKADVPPVYSDEQSDILNAQAAIAIIGKLIVSEASELVNNPAEACDIQILLSAVSSLRCFIGREQQQSLGENDVSGDSMYLAAEGDAEKAETVEKAKYSAEQLRDMLAAGKAMKNPDGDPSYPIGDVEDLENAIHAVGRGKGDHGAIRSYIKGRAKALGKSDLIPDSWDTSKAADIEETPVPEGVEPAVEATKTVEPDAAKAVSVFDEDAMFKSLEGDLNKADSPLHKLFKAFVEAQATELVEASTKSAAEALGELGARLEKVESMATPGGPALRRTEVERTNARRGDLVMEAARFKALASNTEDPDLRKGYGAKAAQLEAEIKAL